MEVITYFGEGFDCNSYLVVDKEDAVLIDCSVSVEKLTKDLSKSGANLRHVILTHGHFDHISTLDEVRSITGASVLINEKDAEMLTDAHKNGFASFFMGDFSVRATDGTFRDGDVITVGDISLEVIHTPGHSKGSSCFKCGDVLFTGDTLFAGNIGRSDLFGGDGATLFRSLKMIAEIPGDFEMCSGHGPITTLERERKRNYYIRDAYDFE